MAKRVVVIGAGPAGLVSLKTLLHLKDSQFDPILLEASHAVGGTFDQRSYESGCLVSSKQLTAFSDYRMTQASLSSNPDDHDDTLPAPDHPTMDQYVQYLRNYARHFQLHALAGPAWNDTVLASKPRINFGARVIKMEPTEKNTHEITFQLSSIDGQTTTHTIIADAVAICSGLHVTPAVPEIPGLATNLVAQNPPILTSTVSTPPGLDMVEIPGVRVIHSSQYKNLAEFAGRNVLLLGVGETGMDLAYHAIKSQAKSVVLCHRGGFLSFPKQLSNFRVFGQYFEKPIEETLPIDGLITNLFETCYVHPWIAKSNIRWFVSDFGVKRVMWALTGTTSGCNQWVGGLPNERLGRAYVFLNKSSRAMPYINRPYKPLTRIATTYFGTEYVDPIDEEDGHKIIDLALWPSHVDTTGRVHFTPASELPAKVARPEEARMAQMEIRPDLVIYCTGYKVDSSWLHASYPRPKEADIRSLCRKDDLSIAYIGFVRPGVGAIPPIAEMQAQLWSLLLLGKVEVPTSEPHYRLYQAKNARITHGVDHGAYMSTLAVDIGSSPNLSDLFFEYGAHVTLCYCFGAAFPTFYRLTGPFKNPELSSVVKGEIWETITRRGLLGNLFMGVIPMAFYGTLSAICCILELLLFIITPLLSLVGIDVGSKKAVGKIVD